MSHQTMFDLSGKVALITGASRGIGEAIAFAYSQAGARVVLASRKQADLDRVAERIRESGGDVLAMAAHTGDMAAISAVVEKATAAFGGIDVVVNNAATNPHFGPILTAEDSHWDKILDVNVKGYFRVVKACVASMQARGGGKVINMSSVAGLEPRISERPNYLAMRDLLAGLRAEMVLNDGQEPKPETMKEIREQAAKLVHLALQRKQ
jgi:NAD(P)-dependent dehydrogenase (short-subunit alcohol dehydrogenase family)